MHITQQLMIQLKAEMYREIKHKIYILKEIFTAGGGGEGSAVPDRTGTC